jgi:hypothetical protein
LDSQPLFFQINPVEVLTRGASNATRHNTAVFTRVGSSEGYDYKRARPRSRGAKSQRCIRAPCSLPRWRRCGVIFYLLPSLIMLFFLRRWRWRWRKQQGG